MRKFPIIIKLLVALIGVLFLAVLVYQLPPVNERLSWRMDIAQTYLRNLISPAGELPTPQTSPLPINKSMPSPTPRPSPVSIITITPTPSQIPLPASVILTPPKWERQGMNNCGPASLSMYLHYYGWEGNQYDISKMIKPAQEDRNVNVEELAYYARTHVGWLSVQYRVGGTINLLKQLLVAGYPMMIEEGFRLPSPPAWFNDDLWSAHYLLITGYDDVAGVFIGQDSYHGPDQKVLYESLDKNWQLFNRVYILLYPLDQENTIKAILGPDWNPDINRQNALATAQTEAQANPDNPFPWFNQGTNLVYFERYTDATAAFDKARELGLPQRMLRYQFGPFIADFQAGRYDDLLELTKYALKRTPNSEEALLWQGWALYRLGKVAEARIYFKTALDANRYFSDAVYALDFIEGK
jgi:hypothetical protein